MVSNLVMFKIIATKFAIIRLRVDLLLFFSQWIHFDNLWVYIWYEFVLFFQVVKKTFNTSGPLYVKISPLYLESCATRKYENLLGLCNSFVSVFNVVPLSCTGMRNVVAIKYHRNRERFSKVFELQDIVFCISVVFRWWLF